MIELYDFLRQRGAGKDLVAFAASYRNLADLWENCPRSDWMLWLLENLDGSAPHPELRLFACWCARKFWMRMSDNRSKIAVDTAETYARGNAMRIELQVARDAAAKAAEELIREADLAGASIAWIAHATTLPTTIDAAKSVSARSIMAIQLVVPIGRPTDAVGNALFKYAEKLREIVANPFRETRRPVTREKQRTNWSEYRSRHRPHTAHPTGF